MPSQRECLSVFVAVSTCEIRDLLNTQQERHQPKFCFIRFQREQFSFRNKRLSCSHDCSWSDQRASAFHRCAAYSVFTLTVTTNKGKSTFSKVYKCYVTHMPEYLSKNSAPAALQFNCYSCTCSSVPSVLPTVPAYRRSEKSGRAQGGIDGRCCWALLSARRRATVLPAVQNAKTGPAQ